MTCPGAADSGYVPGGNLMAPAAQTRATLDDLIARRARPS